MLPTSLANLVRKGFQETYDTEIFVSLTGTGG
jgi:pantothenate kinase